MINPVEVEGNLDEPLAIRGVSKTKLYRDLSDTFYLPKKDSRGITRSYLVRVYSNQVYRLERHLLLQFEAGLSVQESKKSAFYSVNLLAHRLERLLHQLHEQPLGFGDGVTPEEEWFTRVLRYVDRTNILGGFRVPVRDNPVPNIFCARA